MARLYGERKSTLPVLIGVALLALVGIGGYYMYQNRGADAVAIAPGEVNVVDNAPGNMVSNGDVDAERNGNTVTIGSGADNANPNPNDAAGTGNTVSSGATADGANNAENPAHTDMSGHSSAPSGTANTGNSASGNSASGATAGSETSSTEEAGTRERSKTITDNKTGTTVTYKKKVSEDGSVTREKTQTGATPPVASSGP